MVSGRIVLIDLTSFYSQNNMMFENLFIWLRKNLFHTTYVVAYMQELLRDKVLYVSLLMNDEAVEKYNVE